MKPKVRLLIACLLLLVVLFALFVYLASRPRYYASGRILIARPQDSEVFDPYFYGTQLETISNFLSQSAITATIVENSGAKRTKVEFAGAWPIRSTSLVDIRFVGTDRTNVWCVASNASLAVIGYYATNQSKATTEYIGTVFWKPRNYWDWLIDKFSSFFN